MIASDAKIYLKKAHEDLVVIIKLEADKDVADASWGFHAHQTVEKLLKCILSKNKIEFSKTHDLVYLYELLPTNSIHLFQSLADDYENLNPFAVALRYDDFFDDIAIDRSTLLKKIKSLFELIDKELN